MGDENPSPPVIQVRQARFSFRGEPVELVVHANEYISNVIRTGDRFFEQEILEFLLTHFPSQKTIVDVGANIGNHARFFSQFLKPTALHCFEPFPPNFVVLNRNLAEVATLYPMGLGDRPRKSGIRYNEENLGIAVLDETIPGEIEVRTLDSFGFDQVTLLKIDVEGDDVAVLRGARATITRCRPVIVVEGDYEKLAPELQPLGYLCTTVWINYNTYCFEPLLG